jgi:hypothetical protein
MGGFLSRAVQTLKDSWFFAIPFVLGLASAAIFNFALAPPGRDATSTIMGIVMGGFLFGLLWCGILLTALVLWARRGTARRLKRDPPYLRTHVTFSGQEPSFFDPEAEASYGEAPGLPLFKRLCQNLRDAGLRVLEPEDDTLSYFQTCCGIHQDNEFDITFGAYGDDAWLMCVDPAVKNWTEAQLTAIVNSLHQAIARTEGIFNIRWHRREDFTRGNEDDGHPAPLEEN